MGRDFSMEGGIFYERIFLLKKIFLCMSERLDLCQREKYALNE